MIRVKLYVLNENRQWDDKGKGYVSVVARQPNAPELVSSITKTSNTSNECVKQSSDELFKSDSDLNSADTEDEDLPENDENTLSSASAEKTDCSNDSDDSETDATLDESDQNVDTGAGSPSAKIAKLVNETCPLKKEMMIVMKSEADPNVTLLCSKIQADTLYQKQQDTLIVWNSETEGDLALSFEEIKGCTTIHEQIWAYQNEISEGNADDSCQDPAAPDHFGSISSLPVEAGGGWISLPGGGTSDREGNSLPSNLAGGAARNGSLPGTPGNGDAWMSLMEIGKLDTLRCYITRHMIGVDIIESERLIPKMIDLFKKCEDLDNLAGLHNLYSIFKTLISLGKTAIFEILFSPEHIDDVIGILEYVPDKPRQYHRQFIANATLKEALPIKKPNLLQKIRQTYKVQYIHDVIIPTPPIMEEMNLYTMQSFIYVNKAEIVTMIKEDTAFLKAIIVQIMKDDSSYEEKKNSFGFFKELCAYSQCLDAVMRETFFFDNVELGILKAISHILAIEIDESASQGEIDDTVELQWSAVEVLAYFIEVCPIVVRDFIMEDHKKNLTSDETLLINLLLVQMLNDRDPELGRALQVLNLFPILLDFSIDTEEGIVAAAVSRQILDPYRRQLDIKDSFLSMFYSRSVPILISPLLSMTSADEPTETLCRDDYRSALLAQVVLRLLIYCLSHGHGFHIRNYLLKNELIGRFMQLMKSKHTFLVLTALKFLRAVIGLKDDVFTRHIVSNKLLQPVVDCFLRNGNKYNLLNSALIEFFDFMRSENIKLLIQNFGELYLPQFQDVQYVNTFKDLKIRYSQLVEYEKNNCSVNVSGSVGTSLIGNDYSSDSEGSSISEKSTLSFLSPTVLMDSSSSPSGGSSAKNGARSSATGPLVSSILEYDWLNSEDDDDDDAMPNDSSEQLLADDNMIDDAKWTEQWDFHTSQLQKKRLQKQQSETESSTSGNSPIFEPVSGKKVLGKKSAVGSIELKVIAPTANTGVPTFNIKPIRKFPETLASVDASNALAENGSSDEATSSSTSNQTDGENGKVVTCGTNSDATGQNKLMVAPPPRSSTPNSLVDYDSDSDEDETKSEENNEERSSIEQEQDNSNEASTKTKTNRKSSELDDTNTDGTLEATSSEQEEADADVAKSNYKRQLAADNDDDESCFQTTSQSDQNSGQQASVSPPRKRSKSIEESDAPPVGV